MSGNGPGGMGPRDNPENLRLEATSRITDEDLQAFVDDQLGRERRIAVEAHLREHPELAARVMADRYMRDELQQFLSAGEPLSRHQVLARRLQRRLRFRFLATLIQHSAAAASLIAFGWLAHALASGPTAIKAHAAINVPAYVDIVLDAYRPESVPIQARKLDQSLAEDLFGKWFSKAGKAVPIPEIPGNNIVLGVATSKFPPENFLKVYYQVEGSGVAILYAVKRPAVENFAPRLAVREDTPIAYWQMGQYGYALVGLSPKRLIEVARIMAFAM